MGKIAVHKGTKFHGPVFPEHQDRHAHIDTIVASVKGDLAAGFEQELTHYRSTGILQHGVRQMYARRADGVWSLTGNPVTVLYGKTTKFRNVPHQRVRMNSETAPLTAAEVSLLIKRLCVGSPEIVVSSVDLTFDISNSTVGHIWRHVIHRARRECLLQDEHGCRTLYIGAPTSSWQARIYDKTESVRRIEFILRKPFLVSHEIQRLEDVLLLRRMKLWDRLSVRRFSRREAERATKEWEVDDIYRDVIVDWTRYRPRLHELVRFLKGCDIEVDRVLPKTNLQRTLETMLRRLHW